MNNNQSNLRKSGFGLTGNMLKLIAFSAMLLDHIGASVIARYLAANHIPFFGLRMLLFTPEQCIFPTLQLIYRLLRAIGRIAFPLYCFLLVEGYLHTRNFVKYALNLLLFGLISEIPFDLAFFGTVFYPDHQNVFFTLLFGLLGMRGIDFVLNSEFTAQHIRSRFMRYLLSLLPFMLSCAAAYLLNTDYSYKGVAAILLMYYAHVFIHPTRWQLMLIGLLPLVFSALADLPVILCLIPVCFYNGQRGRKNGPVGKYIFYIAYPLHLAVLSVICLLMGI